MGGVPFHVEREPAFLADPVGEAHRDHVPLAHDCEHVTPDRNGRAVQRHPGSVNSTTARANEVVVEDIHVLPAPMQRYRVALAVIEDVVEDRGPLGGPVGGILAYPRGLGPGRRVDEVDAVAVLPVEAPWVAIRGVPETVAEDQVARRTCASGHAVLATIKGAVVDTDLGGADVEAHSHCALRCKADEPVRLPGRDHCHPLGNPGGGRIQVEEPDPDVAERAKADEDLARVVWGLRGIAAYQVA